jgi:integrase
MKLTDTAVKRLKCPTDKKQIDYWDLHPKGLGLRIGASGTKTFNCQTRVLRVGRWRDVRVKIGNYPIITLEKARERAIEIIRLAKAGEDPKLVERETEREAIEQSRNTFSICRADFLKRHCEKNFRPSTFKECRRVLESADFKDWESRPVSSISKRDTIRVLDGVVDRGAEYMANRTLSYGRMMFNWLIERGVVESSPFDHVKNPTKEKARNRTLKNFEIKSVWSAIEVVGGVFEIPAKLMLLTGQREGEVIGMQRSELKTWRELVADDVENDIYADLDLDRLIWSLPKERVKNGRSHIVPLSHTACSLLSEVPHNGTDSLFISQSAITRSKKLGRPAFALSGLSNAKKRVDKESGVTGWVWHDLRRTVVTAMNGQLGIQPHVVEAIINHQSGVAKAGIAGIYNRATYLSKRSLALDAWASLVEKIVSGSDKGQSNVTPLASGRGKLA